MATQDYLEESISNVPREVETEGGSFKDYAQSYNIFGMSAYNPQTRINRDDLTNTWTKEDKLAAMEGLETPEDYDILNSSMSPEHYNKMVAKNKIYKESEARIANDNPVFSFTAGMAVGMADPTVLIPGTLAFKGTKAMTALKRVAYGAGTGAGLSMFQEAVLAEQQGRVDQTGSAAFWGATFGGGLFAVGPMIAGGQYAVSKAAAKAYTEPSISEKFMMGDMPEAEYNPGDEFFTYKNEQGVKTQVNINGVGTEPEAIWFEAPKMNKFVSKFVISPVSRLAKSEYPLFNRLGTKMQSSPIFRTQGGKLFAEPKNAWDKKQNLGNFQADSTKDLYSIHHEIGKQGYKGSFNDYSEEVGAAMDDMINKASNDAHDILMQEMKVADEVKETSIANIEANYKQSFVDQQKNIMESPTFKDLELRQAELKRLEEVNMKSMQDEIDAFNKQFDESQVSLTNNKYSERLSELLSDAETKIDFEGMPPHIAQGIKAYQRYVKKYHMEMDRLNMKDTSKLHPLLYKTRSWNLERLASLDDIELTSRIREAFINDPLNKRLLASGKMKETTANKRIAEIVRHMREVDLVRGMPDNTLTVPNEMPLGQFLEQRNFNLNEKYLGDLVDRDMSSIMSTYHYNMSGRVALQEQFGTDNLAQLRNDVIKPAAQQAKDMGASSREIENLTDDFNTLFEQVLGTHGMPQKPNAWGERMTRQLMKFNYLTFGGGFGINALADMGVVSFTVGLGNTMKHFGPSLKAIQDLKGQAEVTPWVEQAIALGAASDYYNMRTLSRFDDVDTMFTDTKMERVLDKGGQVMQQASGLAPITAMEEMMAIGGGTVDMINTARKFKETGKLPNGFEEKISRYGLTKEDLKWVAEQPVIIENGRLIDFNWGEWKNKQKMEKFQTAITKTMNDAVIRGDKTMLPHYMTSANPFMKLMTQFLRYPHIAYERVLLRGASKPTARFMSGTMTSAAIMSSIYYLREQALIEAGVLDERDAKYAIYDRFGNFDDEAMMRLSWTVASKLPQLGISMDVVNKGIALGGKPTPGRHYDENAWTAIGGVAASRFENVTKGLDAAFDGKFDSMQGYYLGKSITPFQNFLNLDQVYNPMVKDLIEGR